jgi:coenzyme PQQ synthesis protein D (PqqD)
LIGPASNGRSNKVPTDASSSASAPVAIHGATVISRSPSVLTAEVDGEVVMMSIEQGRYFGLDDIGSDVWKRLDQPCSFATLIDRLVADYDADRATIAADVEALLGRMAAQDVVRLA